MTKKPTLTPGTRAKRSGQYEMVGPRGGRGPERTVVRNEPLPPTLHPGSHYRLADATRTKK